MDKKHCIHCDFLMNKDDTVCPSCHKSQFADSYTPDTDSLYMRILKSNLFKAIVIVLIMFIFVASCNAR